jgi:hypothetical protein
LSGKLGGLSAACEIEVPGATPSTHLLCAGLAPGKWRITSPGGFDHDAVVEPGKNILLAELPGGRYRISRVAAGAGQ